MLLTLFALVVHLLSCAADRVPGLDPMRGINPATKAERDLLMGRWS
jgi:hypothetical protein